MGGTLHRKYRFTFDPKIMSSPFHNVPLRVGLSRHRKSKIEIEKLVIGQQAEFRRRVFDFRPNLGEESTMWWKNNSDVGNRKCGRSKRAKRNLLAVPRACSPGSIPSFCCSPRNLKAAWWYIPYTPTELTFSRA